MITNTSPERSVRDTVDSGRDAWVQEPPISTDAIPEITTAPLPQDSPSEPAGAPLSPAGTPAPPGQHSSAPSTPSATTAEDPPAEDRWTVVGGGLPVGRRGLEGARGRPSAGGRAD